MNNYRRKLKVVREVMHAINKDPKAKNAILDTEGEYEGVARSLGVDRITKKEELKRNARLISG